MSIEQLFNRAREENVLNSVLFELTYGCNLDCTFCYNDLSMTGRRVSLEQYKATLDELADMAVLYLAFSGGEPLMYKHFFELGAYAREKGFVIKVKSNGVPLNQRNAERLKAEVDPFIVDLSLHGANPQTHDRLTQVPGSFERLLRNIAFLQSLDIRLKLNAPLTRWNEGEVADMFALADSIGVPLEFDPEISPRDDGDMTPLEIAPSRKGIENMVRLSLQRSRLARDPDRIPVRLKPEIKPDPKLDRKKHKVCGAGSTNLTIDPFGNVYPCVQFRRSVGNIHEQTIREIWTGSGELKNVRDLASRALEIAREKGFKQFCMGLNELRTGNALETHESKLKINRIYERINWELREEDQDVA